MANTILYQTDRKRLTDDGIQWILWERKGNPREKASGYQAKSFCRQRTSLIRAIQANFGGVPPELAEIIGELPLRHPGEAK